MQKKRNLKNQMFYFIIFLAFVYIIYNEFAYSNDSETLINNFIITDGKIIDLGMVSGRGGHPPIYKYKIGSDTYKSSIRSNQYCGYNLGHIPFEKIKNFNFPVIFDPSKPETSRIILKIQDYDKYNIQIPDTLAEVLVEYFNCDQYRVIRQSGKQTRIVKIK